MRIESSLAMVFLKAAAMTTQIGNLMSQNNKQSFRGKRRASEIKTLIFNHRIRAVMLSNYHSTIPKLKELMNWTRSYKEIHLWSMSRTRRIQGVVEVLKRKKRRRKTNRKMKVIKLRSCEIQKITNKLSYNLIQKKHPCKTLPTLVSKRNTEANKRSAESKISWSKLKSLPMLRKKNCKGKMSRLCALIPN